MAEPLRIFLSHSSKDDKLTRSLCERLINLAGGQPLLEVLVDLETLRAGQPWPIQLHEMMAYCHAAVLLLTKSAVDSGWVLKEATILAWRAAIEPDFRLFVVRLPEVKDDELRAAKFDPLMLNVMQRVLGQDAESIAKELIRAFPAIRLAETPLDELMEQLVILLKQVAPERLAKIGRQLQLPPPSWRPGQDTQLRHAELMARQIVRGSLGSYQNLRELIDDVVAVVSRDTVREIFRLIAPYWVPAEAACCLPALGAGLPKRAAVMDGNYVATFTAEMYVNRAHLPSRAAQVIPVSDDSAGDHLEHVTNAICDWYRRTHPRRMLRGNDEVTHAINAPRGNRPPFRYVVVPFLPPADVVRNLVGKFPTLRFIFAGEKQSDEAEWDELVEWVCPPIDRHIEDEQLEIFEDIEHMLSERR